MGDMADDVMDAIVEELARESCLREFRRVDISAFLARQRKLFTQKQWSESYQSWAKGGRAWDRLLGLGGTDTQSALTWYQHIHRPGSKEWRPSIIIRALEQCVLCEKIQSDILFMNGVTK